VILPPLVFPGAIILQLHTKARNLSKASTTKRNHSIRLAAADAMIAASDDDTRSFPDWKAAGKKSEMISSITIFRSEIKTFSALKKNPATFHFLKILSETLLEREERKEEE
jgi:hypothetical protein